MKRYEIVATAWKEEDSDGEFVRFKDAQAEIDRLNKACDQRAAHEYKLMGEIDALKAQRDEFLADLSAATEVGDQATPADIVGVVKAMWEELHWLLKQADALKAQNVELISAFSEVLRISDRQHDAWDAAKAAIAKARGESCNTF